MRYIDAILMLEDMFKGVKFGFKLNIEGDYDFLIYRVIDEDKLKDIEDGRYLDEDEMILKVLEISKIHLKDIDINRLMVRSDLLGELDG